MISHANGTSLNYPARPPARGHRAKPPQSPPKPTSFLGVGVSGHMLVRESTRKSETDRHTSHTQPCARGRLVVPLQGLVLVPETLPWPSIPYTLRLRPSCHFTAAPSSGPQPVPRTASAMWQFSFLEKVPRGTTAKACPRSSTGLPVAGDCSPNSSPPTAD